MGLFRACWEPSLEILDQRQIGKTRRLEDGAEVVGHESLRTWFLPSTGRAAQIDSWRATIFFKTRLADAGGGFLIFARPFLLVGALRVRNGVLVTHGFQIARAENPCYRDTG
jgi:hypothetical protein